MALLNTPSTEAVTWRAIQSGRGLPHSITLRIHDGVLTRGCVLERDSALPLWFAHAPLHFLMRATAAMPATAAVDFLIGRHAAQLQRFGNILVHRFLHLGHVLLRLDETGRHRIAKQRVTVPLVGSNL